MYMYPPKAEMEKKRADTERLSIDIMGKMKHKKPILSADEAVERAKRPANRAKERRKRAGSSTCGIRRCGAF